jgi:moderate conductance mechanosensitive channel
MNECGGSVLRRVVWFLSLVLMLVMIGTWSVGGAIAQTADAGNDAPLSDKQALGALVATLNDDARRSELIKHLQALHAAMPAEKPSADAPKGATATPADDTEKALLQEQLTEVAGAQTKRLFSILGNIGDAFVRGWGLPAWFEYQVTNTDRRAFWLEIGTGGLLLPILVALLARWIVGMGLGGAIRRLRDSVPDTLRGRVFTGLARALLEAASVAAVFGAGYAALALLERSDEADQIALFIIQAIAGLTGIGVIARLILAPHAEALRPVPLASVTAAYLYLWVMRLALIGTVGFIASRTAIPLGASVGGAQAVQILSAIVFAGLTFMLVMQSRDAVAKTIRGDAGGAVRRRLADIWHVLALIYILLVFGVFVSGARDGFIYLVHGTGVTLAATLSAVIASMLLDRLLRKVFELDPELDARFPGLRTRSNLYRPVLKRGIDVLLIVAVVLALLAGWDVQLLDAFSPQTRLAILKGSGTIILVLVLCVLAWELASGAISRALAEATVDGKVRQPGSRAKTLLPLLRRAILVVLVVFGGLVILAEIGIEIAPLLAGAGVLGLAIGFGSQALVRDVITGLFILIEDTIAVGDYVTVGGHSGVVEDLSIRTIKLRDVSGTVHTVPFGDVTTVENFTKDFSYALLDIGVGYSEDTDVVCTVLGEIGTEIFEDEGFRDRILTPLEIMGVHELGDSAVVIRARIKTKPMLQWGVRREFYRRIKQRFDALGIEIPFPHQTVYFGENKEASLALERYRAGGAADVAKGLDGGGTGPGSE